MAKLNIVRLNVASVAKFAGIVGACCGPVTVLIMFAVSYFFYTGSRATATDFIVALVAGSAVLAFWGVCVGALVAAVFNLISRLTGGLAVEAE